MATIQWRPSVNALGSLLKKHSVALLAGAVLSGAITVGALAADSGNPVIAPIISLLLNRDKSIPYTELNEPVKLISVSSGSSDSLTADWLPSEDTVTSAALMRYTLHVSTDEGFEPSAATAKGSVTGKETLTVSGLQPDTQYFALIAATDTDGHESWSNRLPARTVATAAVRTSAVVEAQEQGQNPVVTPDAVTYTAEQVPAAGEYLASAEGDGYLRKVVSATSTNGVVTAQTESASLNEVLDTFEVSTTVKIARVPESGGAMEMMKAANGSSTPARTHRWSQSGLTLRDSNQETQDQKLLSTASGKLTLSEEDTARTEQTVTGHYINITGPKYLAVSPGTTLKDSVDVKLKYDSASQKREICRIILKEFTHDDSTLNKLSRPSARQSIAADKKTGSLNLSFSPTVAYIDKKNRPYEATIKVYIDEKGEGCNGDGYVTTWDETEEMKIPVYVQQGRLEVDDEEKTVTFSGDFTVTNQAELDFEPALNIDLKASGMSLKRASLVAVANIRLANTLTIEASAEGNLNKTVPLLEERSFVKVFPVGNVPVVVRGVFKMDAKIDGHIGGAAKLTKFMELSFPDTSFGVQYSNGSWQEVKNFTPKYTFTIDGEADADASITLTLIPDLQIHFYEAASGRMILEPSLYAEAALHGQFKYHDINGDVLTDLDYWFPYINAGVALDMRLYAGLHIMDYNIVSWPSDISYTETDKFKVFHPITREEGKLYSLPALEASVDMNPSDPPDSRAIQINGTSTDYITPLFGWNLNPFQAWTEPKVITNEGTLYTLTPLDETRKQHWFVPKQAGDFTVRLGGYSKLGWFVRQVADDIVLNLPDADANGVPDYWETRFNISDLSGDDDNDGLDNLAEFNQGTDPTELDSDGGGISDGQELIDGTDPLDDSDDKVLSVVTVAGGSITEGNSGTKNLAFTLTLNEYQDTASVDYTTQDGTASAGSDYVATSGTVSFSGGSTSETVNVSILGDTDVEPNETFSLVLSNPMNLTLENTSVAGMITNDDADAPSGGALNDTGITWGGDYPSGNNTSCTGVEIGGQDCSHGRDVTHNDDSDGHAGFSYTKLDSNGVPLTNQAADYATTPWACVRDNVTGLIWEVKTDDGGLHDKDDTYTWYNTDSTTNGGTDGIDGATNDTCFGYSSGTAATYCNTQAYVNRVNTSGWCGANDWRMPTIKELESIVVYGDYLPAIDTEYFSNAVMGYVWSGSPYVYSTDTDYARLISFCYSPLRLGGAGPDSRNNNHAVRLVRGGQ